MKRKDKPLHMRVLGTVSSFAFLGACGYAFFTSLTLLSGMFIGIAFLSIIGPVLVGGGNVIEMLGGIVEAFIEGLLGIFDAIASIFDF